MSHTFSKPNSTNCHLSFVILSLEERPESGVKIQKTSSAVTMTDDSYSKPIFIPIMQTKTAHPRHSEQKTLLSARENTVLHPVNQRIIFINTIL